MEQATFQRTIRMTTWVTHPCVWIALASRLIIQEQYFLKTAVRCPRHKMMAVSWFLDWVRLRLHIVLIIHLASLRPENLSVYLTGVCLQELILGCYSLDLAFRLSMRVLLQPRGYRVATCHLSYLLQGQKKVRVSQRLATFYTLGARASFTIINIS